MLADRFPRGPPVPAAKCWRAMGSDWGLKKSVRRGIGCRTICDRKNLTAHTTSFLFLFLRVCIGPHGIPIMKTKSLFLFLSLFLLFFGGNRLSTSEKDFPGRWWGGTRPAAFACNRLYTVKTKTTDQSGRRACFLRLLYHFFFCQRKKETDFFPPKRWVFRDGVTGIGKYYTTFCCCLPEWRRPRAAPTCWWTPDSSSLLLLHYSVSCWRNCRYNCCQWTCEWKKDIRKRMLISV